MFLTVLAGCCWYQRRLDIANIPLGIYGGEGFPLLTTTFISTISTILLVSAIRRFINATKEHPALQESKSTINTHLVLFMGDNFLQIAFITTQFLAAWTSNT